MLNAGASTFGPAPELGTLFDRLDRAGSVALNSDLVFGARASWTPATDTPSSNSSWTSTSE